MICSFNLFGPNFKGFLNQSFWGSEKVPILMCFLSWPEVSTERCLRTVLFARARQVEDWVRNWVFSVSVHHEIDPIRSIRHSSRNIIITEGSIISRIDRQVIMSPRVEEVPADAFDSNILVLLQPIPFSDFTSFCSSTALTALIFFWKPDVKIVILDDLVACRVVGFTDSHAQKVEMIALDFTSLTIVRNVVPKLTRGVKLRRLIALNERLRKSFRP